MSDESPRDDRISSDPKTIREWAVDRDVVPVETAGTGGTPGLDLVPASEGEAYELLEWEEFADLLAESELVVHREGDDLDVVHGEQVEQGTYEEPVESGGAGDPSVEEDPRTVESEPGTEEPGTTGAEPADPGSTDHGTRPGKDEPVDPEIGGSADPERGGQGASDMDESTDLGVDEPVDPEMPEAEREDVVDEPIEDDPGMGMGPDDPVERERREHGTSPGGTVERGGSALDEGDEGKTVVDDAGQEVGMVVAIDEDEGLMYVDPNPSFTQKVMAKIGWGSADEGDYPVEEERIQEVTDDEVVLKAGSAFGEADRA